MSSSDLSKPQPAESGDSFASPSKQQTHIDRECQVLGHEFCREHEYAPSTCLHCGEPESPAQSPVRFWFAPNGFENTPHPCICMDDPLGGDPKILALISVIYRPTDLHGLCSMANHYMESSEALR